MKEKINNSILSPLGVFGILLVVGFAIMAFALIRGLNNISVLTNIDGISVSGTAVRYVKSDNANVNIMLRSVSLGSTDAAAVENLKSLQSKTLAYLKSKNLKEENITVQTLNKNKMCTLRDKEVYDNCVGVTYNEYTQLINISSEDVDLIGDVADNITLDMIKYGDITVYPPTYLYTKLDSIKTAMLNEATKNAYERAESIAKSTGNSAGEVMTATQGVFQVTSKDSVDTSDYGMYDTSTIDKKVTAVVRVSFKVK